MDDETRWRSVCLEHGDPIVIEMDDGFRKLDEAEKDAALRQMDNAGNIIGQVTNFMLGVPEDQRQAEYQRYMQTTLGSKPELEGYATEIDKLMGMRPGFK